MHWADQLADRIIERSKKENKKPNIKCQQTPSGGKHIGNLNDVVRAYFPYKAILEKGVKVEFVHTSDDRDPMKNIPSRIADLDGKWHDIPKKFKKYLGIPYSKVPDPFGCCESWSKHFTKVWMKGLKELKINPKLFYTTDLYEKGEMDPYIRKVFEKIKLARKIISKHQRTKGGKDYIPYNAICENCGKITAKVVDFDLEEETVDYVCSGKKLKKRDAQGCGHKGTTHWRNGKLIWRFEWPALWALFNTTFEPFGKDHAEGSWPSGKEIAKKIYGINPPIPFVYEFFLVSGKKMSASKGNVLIAQDVLNIMEVGPFLYFYAKKPSKQRDFDIENIYQLIDEYDMAERVYFGSDEVGKSRAENMKRMYELSTPKIPKKKPRRVPYTFCSLVPQLTRNKEKAMKMLEETGHLEGATKKDKERAWKRIKFSENWVKTFAPKKYKIKVQEKAPDKIKKSIPAKQKEALLELKKLLDKKWAAEELQSKIYEIARETGSVGNFFKSLYKVLINKKSGPRAGQFIITIGKKKVQKILEQLE